MYYNNRPKNAQKGGTIVCFHPIIISFMEFAKIVKTLKPKGWSCWTTLRLIGSSCWVFETCHDYFDHDIETFMFVQVKIRWTKIT